MNQTKNYLVMKSVSLIVDYFVVMTAIQVQTVPTHYLVAAVAAVDCLQSNWKYSRRSLSELQRLLLAASE